jgi:penicillin-binding protein 1A
MLRAVVEIGTARKAASLPFLVAGKTGTTDDQRDAAFIGFSSRMALGVWMGRDDNTPIGHGETGGRAALPVWIEVMEATARISVPPPWEVPPTITFKHIDLGSGAETAHEGGNTAYAAFMPVKPPETPPAGNQDERR